MAVKGANMVRCFHTRERIILFLSVLVLWIIMPLLVHFSHIDVDYASFSTFYYISAICYILSFLMIIIKDKYVSPIVEVIGAGFAYMVPMFLATYLAYSLNMPLADDTLVTMDRSLGFNWLAFIQFVDSSESLSNWLNTAYGSLKYQLLLTPILLCFVNQIPRAIAFIFGYALMVLIASLITIWFPALGTYTVYELDASLLQNINVKFAYHFLDEFNAVRSGEPFTLELSNAAGIVTFPSVHAGMGFFIIWALWRVKYLNLPCLFLNISMAISAISHANHYLVDVLAGLLLAGIVASIGNFIFLGLRPTSSNFNFKETTVSS
ncbi:MAG: phosphatase PAP2 family protein [Lentilitoribacter sp.]